MKRQIKSMRLKPIPDFKNEAEERAFWESPKIAVRERNGSSHPKQNKHLSHFHY